MPKLFYAILVAAVVLGLTGPVSAVSYCPFDSEDIPQGVPSGTSIQALTVGSVYGYSMITQENAWYTSGNLTGLQSNSFNALSGQGTLNIMADTRLSTKLYGMTSNTVRAIEYAGQGMAFDDSNYFSSISNGNETVESCEQVLGGARAMFSQGSYGSQTLGMVSPGYGLTVLQEIGTGDAAPVKPTGMVGTFTVYGSSGQNYGDMGQDFSTSATFGGISTVAHQFKFNTLTE